jgi:tRNA threonylcarbamoyladenosine biosynthesis protein TsaB
MEKQPNAFFSTAKYSGLNMVALAENAFKQRDFADLAYSEPFYLKEFFSPEPRKNVI